MKKMISVIVIMVMSCLFAAKTSLVYTAQHLPASVPEGISHGEAETLPKTNCEYNVLGYSPQGTLIYDVVITPPRYNRTVLLTFAMHGFEGSWDNDGAALVQIANDIIREFSDHPADLNTTRLIVVPCVNPDGLWRGKSADGFGRCNLQGIDINRDFDYKWQMGDDSKYHTGKVPFSTPEACMLRALVYQEKPDIVIDFHGWLSCTYGDAEISRYFDRAFNIKNLGAGSGETYMQQFFAGWASQYARAVLMEYPDPVKPENLAARDYSNKTIQVIKEICR